MIDLFLNQVLDDARTHKGHIIIREQRCLGCPKTLAVEITDKLGRRGEYWVVKGSLRFKTGMDLLYRKEVWFGNQIRCPNCGREGRLPMDKPLNAERMKSREEKDGQKAIRIAA